MKRLLFIFISMFLFTQMVSAQQIISRMSASAEQHSDGLYYLVLEGDQTQIVLVCSFGDCGRGFASRIDALNYWTSLMSLAYHIDIAPIPLVQPVVSAPAFCHPTCMPRGNRHLPPGLSEPLKGPFAR